MATTAPVAAPLGGRAWIRLCHHSAGPPRSPRMWAHRALEASLDVLHGLFARTAGRFGDEGRTRVGINTGGISRRSGESLAPSFFDARCRRTRALADGQGARPILLELCLTAGLLRRAQQARGLWPRPPKSRRPRALRRERKAREQTETENRSQVGTSTPSLSNPSPMRWCILSTHGAQMLATRH